MKCSECGCTLVFSMVLNQYECISCREIEDDLFGDGHLDDEDY